MRISLQSAILVKFCKNPRDIYLPGNPCFSNRNLVTVAIVFVASNSITNITTHPHLTLFLCVLYYIKIGSRDTIQNHGVKIPSEYFLVSNSIKIDRHCYHNIKITKIHFNDL